MNHPLIIAHRGASGLLPENTLPAMALAAALGADGIEFDLVATRDGRLAVLHDMTLDATTDVAERFPGRARGEDGLHHAADFTLAEIRTLRAGGRRGGPGGPGRFPPEPGLFRVPSLDEVIGLAASCGRARGRPLELFIELKSPELHAAEGHDLPALALAALREHGFDAPGSPCRILSFSAPALIRLRRELGAQLRLVQNLGGGLEDGDPVPCDPEGLREIAGYAQAVGPGLFLVADTSAGPGRWKDGGLTSAAHAAGLQVFMWTFRDDALPEGVDDAAAFRSWLSGEVGLDGIFTDHPGLSFRGAV